MHKEKQLIDIEIDELTPCLRSTTTGNTVDTIVEKINLSTEDYNGWNFDWSIPKEEGYEIYSLQVIGSNVIEGLLALKRDYENNGIYVNLVESAPKNVGRTGEYDGVGGHLFAFACREAKEMGFDFVYFDSKTNLIDYYNQTLGAVLLFGQRMIIENEAFEDLINKYYEEE